MNPGPFIGRCCFLVAVFWAGTGQGSQGRIEVKVILPSRPVVVETNIETRFDPEVVLPALRDVLGREKRFSIVDIREKGLAEDDTAVVLVPVLTSIRVARTKKAGTILEATVYVAGGLWVIDPWTNSVLYSATRLVMSSVEVGVAAIDRQDVLIRQAFLDATRQWVEACVLQLQRDAVPFVVDGLTGVVPSTAKSTPGIWLRGRTHGLKEGMVIGSENGNLARIEILSEKFSVIRDVLDADRRIPEGSRYRALVVSNPVERPEPRMELSWLGPQPATGKHGAQSAALNSSAILDIVQMYASKEGGLRVLPALGGGLAGSKEFQSLSEEISRHARVVRESSGLMTVHRQTMVQRATENPDIVSEVGVLGTFHGARKMPDGQVEQLFRVSLIGTVGFPRSSFREDGWVLAKTVEFTEEIAVAQMEGVVQTSVEDFWFTAWRNAAIGLGKKIHDEATRVLKTNGGGYAEGRVGSDSSVAWPAPRPGPLAPLSWLRPSGEVLGSGSDGSERLGTLYERVTLSRGFLNLRNLSGERVREGDLLRYRGGALDVPALPLLLSGTAVPKGSGMEPIAFSRMVSGALAEAISVRIYFPAGGVEAPGSQGLELFIDSPTIDETTATAKLTGDCRIRVWPSLASRQGEPRLKAGVAYVEERTYDTKKPPLVPRDRVMEIKNWVDAAIKKAAARAFEKGLVSTLAEDTAWVK